MSGEINEISLSTSVFGKEKGDGFRLSDYVDIAAQAGYKYIELSRRQWDCQDRDFDLIEASGIKVWSVHGVLSGDAISPDPELRRKAVDFAYQRALRAARFAPCPLVEHYLDRHSDPELGRYFRESVAMLYEKVSKLGYILCIETAPWKPKLYDRHPDSPEIAEFVRSFGKDDLQMTIDINHSNLHEDLVDVANNCRGLIKNIHVSNNNGTWEDHLPPQTGVIDMKRTFDALRANGYSGPCNLEFRFGEECGIPSLELLRDVRLYMEKLLWNRD